MSELLTADVVVVGAGIHGSSAALHLARAGKDTILLDQFPIPHCRGSSHGQSRIIRLANYGIPQLSPIMADSFKKWLMIEQQTGQKLLRRCPLLAVGQENDKHIMDRIATSIENGGHTPQWVNCTEVNRKYNMNHPTSSLTLFDPSAGVLMADKCLSSLQRLFQTCGGRLVDEWRVTKVDVDDQGMCEIRGPRGIVRARSVVLCPGPWAGPLLSLLGIKIPLRVERVSVLYWRLRDENTPTTIFIDTNIENHFYGIPQIEYPGMIKLCYHSGIEVDPNNRDQKDTSVIREKVKKYVKETFPCLDAEPAIEESCLYTVSPDHEFILDRHPSHPNIVFACGFSGTGFKIAPVIGEELCRMVLGQSPNHDIKPFSATRFTRTPKSKM